MRKILMAVSAFALLTACGGEQESEYDRYYDSDYQPDTTAVASRPQPPRPATTPPEGGATQDVQTTPAGTPTGPGVAQQQEALAAHAKGEKLIASSDCLACHKVDQKVVGPSYEEVAQKYEFNDKNVDYLAGKIIQGGAGVWGQVPMTAHPNISEADAKEMSRYILSLRN